MATKQKSWCLQFRFDKKPVSASFREKDKDQIKKVKAMYLMPQRKYNPIQPLWGGRQNHLLVTFHTVNSIANVHDKYIFRMHKALYVGRRHEGTNDFRIAATIAMRQHWKVYEQNQNYPPYPQKEWCSHIVYGMVSPMLLPRREDILIRGRKRVNSCSW